MLGGEICRGGGRQGGEERIHKNMSAGLAAAALLLDRIRGDTGRSLWRDSLGFFRPVCGPEGRCFNHKTIVS